MARLVKTCSSLLVLATAAATPIEDRACHAANAEQCEQRYTAGTVDEYVAEDAEDEAAMRTSLLQVRHREASSLQARQASMTPPGDAEKTMEQTMEEAKEHEEELMQQAEEEKEQLNKEAHPGEGSSHWLANLLPSSAGKKCMDICDRESDCTKYSSICGGCTHLCNQYSGDSSTSSGTCNKYCDKGTDCTSFPLTCGGCSFCSSSGHASPRRRRSWEPSASPSDGRRRRTPASSSSSSCPSFCTMPELGEGCDLFKESCRSCLSCQGFSSTRRRESAPTRRRRSSRPTPAPTPHFAPPPPPSPSQAPASPPPPPPSGAPPAPPPVPYAPPSPSGAPGGPPVPPSPGGPPAGQGGPASCSAHPKCNAAGLSGDCCPAPNGANLACCN
eukprot:TRINITY_DN10145_c0_g1_i1.p1 TRINITY_DN10145_c0_g1~~TRINITY_DN10145_c0_g1_i1.p1  ORF type:complete len:387 (-),score=57.50 TRINITY_DN10145_c0_g1_i1:115-1275(-)